jgi:putative tryptophan/tyrosine transport system substrate-binding protein
VRRRTFIAGLGSAVAWPVVARAQQAAMPVVGFLNSQSPDRLADHLQAFHQGLREAGFIEGRNVAVEYRWAEDHYDRLSAMAADLVRRQVAVIATNGIAVAAAKAATTTIPVVFFAVAPDPILAGLVDSLSRPTGNLTGVNSMNMELILKRMGLLHELVSGATSLAFLVNPSQRLVSASFESLNNARNQSIEATARILGLEVAVLEASDERTLDSAFAKLVELRAGGLVIITDPFFSSRAGTIAALALRYRLPTIYQTREFAAASGLASYGASQVDQYRLGGNYVGRILKGEKPADLPVQRVTKFELIINTKTAKTLGLTIPETLLATADEVIQ